MVIPDLDFDYRLPRLLLCFPIKEDGGEVCLPDDQAHYLRTVLRRPDGANLRVFYPESGEFLAQIKWVGKKGVSILLLRQIRPPFTAPFHLHLVFPLLKKDRLDFLIEKAVELGVTDLHPVTTQHSVNRDLNFERVVAQIKEATEQCERLDIPLLSPIVPLFQFLETWEKAIPLYAALERQDVVSLKDIYPSVSGDRGFLVGPEGGFSAEEASLLQSRKFVIPVGLGPRILRTETAALYGLSLLNAEKRPEYIQPQI